MHMGAGGCFETRGVKAQGENMSQSTSRRGTIAETLLNTLEAERYVRLPLLLTIVDELSAREGFQAAAEAARGLLEGLQSGVLAEDEFVARIAALRRLVQAAAGRVFVTHLPTSSAA